MTTLVVVENRSQPVEGAHDVCIVQHHGESIYPAVVIKPGESHSFHVWQDNSFVITEAKA